MEDIGKWCCKSNCSIDMASSVREVIAIQPFSKPEMTCVFISDKLDTQDKQRSGKRKGSDKEEQSLSLQFSHNQIRIVFFINGYIQNDLFCALYSKNGENERIQNENAYWQPESNGFHLEKLNR